MAFVLYTDKPGDGFGNYYPTNESLHFGVGQTGNIDSAHAPYAVPVARFKFYNNRGEPLTNAPTIYIRFNGGFDSNLSQGWQSTQAFGASYAGMMEGNPAKDFLGQFGLGINVIESVGKSAYESLTRQILNAMVGVTGFAASASAGGKTQAEFLMRKMVNNFQQLAYAGPIFRRFQPSFIMRPTSESEAVAMNQIVASFRVASSPQTDIGEDKISSLGNTEQEIIAGSANVEVKPNNAESAGQAAEREQAEAIDSAAAEILSLGRQEQASGTPLTFKYPDMVKYSIYLFVGGSVNLLFDSELCMIENVSTNYGSQSKLAFFDAGESKTGENKKYYPTEVTLTLSLQESVLVTAERAAADYAQNLVMY
jgi:hypothetical protein